MLSPLKLLLFAVLVAAAVAYSGDMILERTNQGKIASKTEIAYEDVNWDQDSGTIRIPMARDGHYWITLDVNGTPIVFMIDTGASHISLSYDAAEMAGLNPASLDYDQTFKTAGGLTQKAMINIDQISYQSIQMTNMVAAVSGQGQMDVSLLGMNFLNRLSGYNVSNRELIIRP